MPRPRTSPPTAFTPEEIAAKLEAMGVPTEKARSVASGKGWARGREFAERSICKTCGERFYAPPVQRKRGGGLYCSTACAGAARRGPNSRNWKPKIVKACPVCGKQFELHPSRASRGRTCSRECATKMRTASRGTCACCGIALTRSTGKYCSRKCYDAARSGSGAWNWKGGTLIDAKCENCGKQFKANRFDVAKGMGRFCGKRCFGMVAVHRRSNHCVGRGGKRSDLGDMYFRSRWEANYARYLNWLIERGAVASWQFEPDTFEFPVKRGSKFYTPDFKVFDAEGQFAYHEVKGYMDQKSATKLKRMSRHYPDIRVTVIGRAEYLRIANLVARMLPGWETDTNPRREIARRL